ncbi:C1 family peptidase [Bradyrhizobium sp. BRP22]|uniref:C1 family peptidase n=1 Tax=Bradyrhizobium sp. BRP22 TaxID=2793821 RepID=UPI001CD5B3F2|nr:C1 family peptidase [Bradyrhizobium sp. BRP22]MCA1454228.1 C1 family peptidase [Bradyrhizobium sp. BRP22]
MTGSPDARPAGRHCRRPHPIVLTSPNGGFHVDAASRSQRRVRSGLRSDNGRDRAVDPACVHRGTAHIRNVNPDYLPPPQAQGTAQHQGSPGSCAAWASTYGLATFTAAAASKQSPSTASLQASPAHIYIQVMKIYGATTCNGSRLDSYLDLLTQAGTPNWATAPYYPNCRELWSSYDANATVDASFQIPGWAMVDTSDLDAIKAVIANGGALCYGTALNEGFGSYNSTSPSPMTGPFNKDKSPDGKLIGHCMLIIGYDDDQQAILIQNSFGPNWGHQWNGSGGYIWMSYKLFQYLAQGKAMYVTA